jgi:hypothetical protein
MVIMPVWRIKIFRPGLYPGFFRCRLRRPVAGQTSLPDSWWLARFGCTELRFLASGRVWFNWVVARLLQLLVLQSHLPKTAYVFSQHGHDVAGFKSQTSILSPNGSFLLPLAAVTLDTLRPRQHSHHPCYKGQPNALCSRFQRAFGRRECCNLTGTTLEFSDFISCAVEMFVVVERCALSPTNTKRRSVVCHGIFCPDMLAVMFVFPTLITCPYIC